MRLFYLLERHRPLLPEQGRWLPARVVAIVCIFPQFLSLLDGLRLETCRDRRLGGEYLLRLLPLRDMLHHERVRGHYVKYLASAVQVVDVLVCLVVLSPLLGLGLCQ